VTLEAALDKLAECRRNIDRIDLQLLALLSERARVAEIIGEVKRGQSMPVYEPKREEQVYKNILENNHGPLPADAVRRIFERVIDEMRNLQKTRMQA
jgi:chorismate mutase/prephenate dehydratase